jgi:peptide/nickel transport system substrate-binding protein
VLEKNEDFWGTNEAEDSLPYLDGITFTFYPDPTARTTALATGNVD